ncbi:hypothetical protein CBW16_03775 [Flavobacteriaceae bacterium JJC]|nr:hypothetical protein CBW16_03775 [Flavobacteriaceae bacterium JJC]
MLGAGCWMLDVSTVDVENRILHFNHRVHRGFHGAHGDFMRCHNAASFFSFEYLKKARAFVTFAVKPLTVITLSLNPYP